MIPPRFSALLCALFIVVVAIAAAPTAARANDFAMPFGGKGASQPAAAAFAANSDESAAPLGAISLASSSNHEGHSGLGGTFAWRPTPVAVGMGEHEDQGGWRHHDDDGDDDGQKTAVPEPSTALLVFSGITALAGWRVRRRKPEISTADPA